MGCTYLPNLEIQYMHIKILIITNYKVDNHHFEIRNTFYLYKLLSVYFKTKIKALFMLQITFNASTSIILHNVTQEPR